MASLTPTLAPTWVKAPDTNATVELFLNQNGICPHRVQVLRRTSRMSNKWKRVGWCDKCEDKWRDEQRARKLHLQQREQEVKQRQQQTTNERTPLFGKKNTPTTTTTTTAAAPSALLWHSSTVRTFAIVGTAAVLFMNIFQFLLTSHDDDNNNNNNTNDSLHVLGLAFGVALICAVLSGIVVETLFQYAAATSDSERYKVGLHLGATVTLVVVVVVVGLFLVDHHNDNNNNNNDNKNYNQNHQHQHYDNDHDTTASSDLLVSTMTSADHNQPHSSSSLSSSSSSSSLSSSSSSSSSSSTSFASMTMTMAPTPAPTTTSSRPTALLTFHPTSLIPTLLPTLLPTTPPPEEEQQDEPKLTPTIQPTLSPTTLGPTTLPPTRLPTSQPTIGLPTSEPTTGLPTSQPTTRLPTTQPSLRPVTNHPTTTMMIMPTQNPVFQHQQFTAPNGRPVAVATNPLTALSRGGTMLLRGNHHDDKNDSTSFHFQQQNLQNYLAPKNKETITSATTAASTATDFSTDSVPTRAPMAEMTPVVVLQPALQTGKVPDISSPLLPGANSSALPTQEGIVPTPAPHGVGGSGVLLGGSLHIPANVPAYVVYIVLGILLILLGLGVFFVLRKLSCCGDSSAGKQRRWPFNLWPFRVSSSGIPPRRSLFGDGSVTTKNTSRNKNQKCQQQSNPWGPFSLFQSSSRSSSKPLRRPSLLGGARKDSRESKGCFHSCCCCCCCC